MSASFRIYRHDSNDSVLLSRDVRDEHPAWVHEQLGTESEAELQAHLDNLDPFAYAGDGLGDTDGVRLDDPQLVVIGDLDGPDEDRGIVHEVSEDGLRARVGWQSGVETWAPVDDLTID